MRGVKSEDLSAIVDFLYFGETSVAQQNLQSFLSIADELKLVGLCSGDEEKEVEQVGPNPEAGEEKVSEEGEEAKVQDDQIKVELDDTLFVNKKVDIKKMPGNGKYFGLGASFP